MIPARLFGRKASGGKIEVLVERMLDDKRILAHIRASKAPKPGAELLLGDDESIKATMTARHDALFEVEFNDERTVLDILNAIGHMPLPPYIERPDEEADRELYQTVYSQKPGAVAAPTAGLHFDEPLLEKLRAKGVEMAFVTLHVGAGTFQPVRVDSIEDHIMHSEYAEVPQEVVDAVLAAKAARQPRGCGGHHLRTFTGERCPGGSTRSDRTVLWRYADLYLPGLSVQSHRCTGDQFPSA